jgi:triosephosphate isomerase
MNRAKIVAGNWKMNLNKTNALELINHIVKESLTNTSVDLVVCPPFTSISQVGGVIESIPKIHLGAQNCHFEKSGAFTGEIAPDMLESQGVTHVIIGHSERRALFGETDEIISKKVKAALASKLTPIICCGEVLEEREKGVEVEVVTQQLKIALQDVDVTQVIIAYEPVWAIGTGKTASPEQAQQMHAAIRDFIKKEKGDQAAGIVPILYGGSCKPNNAKELFAQDDIDGGLIGGASLNAQDFISIAKSF